MRHERRSRAFNIVELVVCLAVVSLMSTGLLVGLAGRVKKARIAACRLDLHNIADAEKQVAIDTGYFMRLYVLDDVPYTAEDRAAGLDFLHSPDFGDNEHFRFIDPKTNDFLADPRATALVTSLKADSIVSGWRGPYYTVRRDDDEDDPKTGTGFQLLGIPDDPWRNDYFLFTRKGLLTEPVPEFVETVEVTVGGESRSFNANFDRPTILSMGPNGLPGDGESGSDFGTDDDIYVQFGY